MENFWPKLPFLLPRSSSFAGQYEAVFWAITLVGLAFAFIVTVGVVFFATRYRRGSKVNRRLPEHEGITLELTWTIIPLIIAIGLFVWASSVYFQMVRPPKDAQEVFVVGKQWMWKLQHSSNGKTEMNELHVPVGRPVKLTMISEDVIHDFYMPAMRIKQDVIPGTYTQLWFTPTEVGRSRIFCAQYCGTNHAIMGGWLTVMEPQDYARWERTGNLTEANTTSGERLFRENGCTGCHGANASVRAPSLNGIWNRPVAIQDPKDLTKTQTIIADYRYLHDSIVLPQKEVAAGFQPIMPSYKGRLSEEELLQLIDYIKSLGTSNGTSNGSGAAYEAGQGAARAGGGVTGAGDNPTGSMGDMRDRDRILANNDQSGTRVGAVNSRSLSSGPVRDMSNEIDRDNSFNGDPTTGRGAPDNSSGGLVNERATRDRLGIYTTPGYVNSASKAYSGMPAAGGDNGGYRAKNAPGGPQAPTRASHSNDLSRINNGNNTR